MPYNGKSIINGNTLQSEIPYKGQFLIKGIPCKGKSLIKGTHVYGKSLVNENPIQRGNPL